MFDLMFHGKVGKHELAFPVFVDLPARLAGSSAAPSTSRRPGCPIQLGRLGSEQLLAERTGLKRQQMNDGGKPKH